MSSADPNPDPIDNLPETAELFDTTIESLCEFGDITLVVEDGFHPELRVAVSSCILASTSKVFKALFKGCFAEGEAIRSGQRDIYIADKPAAMLALCQLLHFKPVKPAIACHNILDFALLVDKYDCVEALKPATDSTLSGLSDGGNPAWGTSWDLAVSAFILDQPQHFRKCSQALVRHEVHISPAELHQPDGNPAIAYLPAHFMGEFSFYGVALFRVL